MAVIVAGNYYRFKSVSELESGNNRYLNILTDKTYLQNQMNVTTCNLYEDDMGQVWHASVYIHASTIQYLLKSVKDTKFVLDRWRGSTNYNNADINEIGINTTDLNDQVIIFVPSGSYYKIKLANQDLYLTVTTTSTYQGHNVNWQSNTGNSNQLWLAESYSSGSGGSSGDESNNTNYLIYPCKVMRITQGYAPTDINASHYYNTRATPIDYPIDEGGDAPSPDRSWLYCPCDEMEVVRITGVNADNTNCIWLRSTSKVVMPCGEDYIVMMVTHPNDDTLSGISVGTKFTRKNPMFLEGNDGLSDGYHFHISLGKGSHTNTGWTKNSSGAWVITTSGGAIKPEEGFFIDRDFTTVSSTGGLSFIDKP